MIFKYFQQGIKMFLLVYQSLSGEANYTPPSLHISPLANNENVQGQILVLLPNHNQSPIMYNC